MSKKILFWIFVFVFAIINVNISFSQSNTCCLEADGYCSSNKETNACVSGGGISLGAVSCYKNDWSSNFNQCSLVSCVFSNVNKCTFTTASRCQALNGRIDNTLDKDGCSKFNIPVVSKGCCVVGNLCNQISNN